LILAEKIESLRRCVQRLEARRPDTVEALRTDADAQDIVTLNLARTVQLCVGMPYLRRRAYQAGWGAAVTTVAGRRHYDALRQRGRKHKEALIIIARKLLRAAHALAQNPEQTVDEERLFALPG
jgi:hypothetical protein